MPLVTASEKYKTSQTPLPKVVFGTGRYLMDEVFSKQAKHFVILLSSQQLYQILSKPNGDVEYQIKSMLYSAELEINQRFNAQPSAMGDR